MTQRALVAKAKEKKRYSAIGVECWNAAAGWLGCSELGAAAVWVFVDRRSAQWSGGIEGGKRGKVEGGWGVQEDGARERERSGGEW